MAHSIYDSQILRGDCWAGVEACYSRTWQDYNMPPHRHNRAELMYVLKGRCLVQVQDEASDESVFRETAVRREKLGAGEYIFIDAGVSHNLEVPQSCYMLNAEFRIGENMHAPMTFDRLRQTSRAFERLLERGEPVFRGVDRDGDIHASLAQIVRDFTRTEASAEYRPLLDAELGRLLLHLALEREHALREDGTRRYVQRAVRLMHERASEEIRISDIADEIGIAPAYLQRIFRQAQGETMIDYLTRVRIERSKLLLSRTEDSVVDIAVGVGYNSRQHFSRVFTRMVGVSPQKYRQEHRDFEKTQIFRFDDVSSELMSGEGEK